MLQFRFKQTQRLNWCTFRAESFIIYKLHHNFQSLCPTRATQDQDHPLLGLQRKRIRKLGTFQVVTLVLQFGFKQTQRLNWCTFRAESFIIYKIHHSFQSLCPTRATQGQDHPLPGLRQKRIRKPGMF